MKKEKKKDLDEILQEVLETAPSIEDYDVWQNKIHRFKRRKRSGKK